MSQTMHPLGGVDHCHTHCHLAKFCDSVIMGKYGAVIGWKYRILYVPSLNLQVMGCF